MTSLVSHVIFFLFVLLMVNTICISRLGFLIDFLSHAAVVGFMAGAAITIGLQQLKGLLGINQFTKKTDIVSVMRSVWSAVDHGVCQEIQLFVLSTK